MEGGGLFGNLWIVLGCVLSAKVAGAPWSPSPPLARAGKPPLLPPNSQMTPQNESRIWGQDTDMAELKERLVVLEKANEQNSRLTDLINVVKDNTSELKNDAKENKMELKNEIDKTRIELKNEIDKTRIELKNEIDKTRIELKNEAKEKKLELKNEIVELKNEAAKNKMELKIEIEQTRNEAAKNKIELKNEIVELRDEAKSKAKEYKMYAIANMILIVFFGVFGRMFSNDKLIDAFFKLFHWFNK